MATKPKVIQQKQFSLSWRDVIISAILSTLLASLTTVYELISATGWDAVEWKTVILSFCITFIGKLIHAFSQSDRALVIVGNKAELTETVKEIKKAV